MTSALIDCGRELAGLALFAGLVGAIALICGIDRHPDLGTFEDQDRP